MSISVSSAFSTLEAIKKDISDLSTADRLRYANYVNRELYRIIKSVDSLKLASSSTISVVSGTASYALPADFRSISEPNMGLYEVDENGNDTDVLLTMKVPGSSARGFYLDSGNIVLTPKPTASETLKLRYIPKLTSLTALTDTFVVDDEWEELVQDGLLLAFEIFDQSPLEVQADQRYMNWKQECLAEIGRTSQVYPIPDITSSYF